MGVILLLVEAFRFVVENVHQLKSTLIGVALNQQPPDLVRFDLAEAASDHVSPHQSNALIEQQLWKEGKHGVGSSVPSLALEIL